MRVMFFGTSAFAVPSLERVVAHHTVTVCVTQPDRPQGRGLVPEPSPVKRTALQLGLPLLQPERLQIGLFEGLKSDVGVVAAYGQLIRQDLLQLPTWGMLGVHPSLLPKYRGAAPVAWAILNGETTTGLTIFRLNEQMDAGEWLVQETIPIEAQETTEGLTERLAHRGAEVLLRALELLEKRTATFQAQEDSAATFAPKLTKTQGRIDWQQPAESIVRLVRATMPWPGASTSWQGSALKLWSVATQAAPASCSCESPAAPGTVVEVSPESLAVATGRGTVKITEIQPAGRRRMSAREFLAGRSIKVGDRFGT